MRSFRVAVLVTLCTIGLAATPITFTHEATGSGTIGTIGFSNAGIVIVATGDTASRGSFGTGFWIDHILASITIDGVGTFDFTTGTRTFVNNSVNIVGFSRAGSGGTDLLNGPINGVYGSWDMLSSIGPHSGSGNFLQWSNSPVNTEAGVLLFSSQSTNVTFTARTGEDVEAVPEPATLTLLALGLAGTRFLKRRSV